MPAVSCTNCGRPYPGEGAPYKCLTCGGIFDLLADLQFDPELVDPDDSTIWKYRSSFELPDDAPKISLGEGNTPLVFSEAFGKRVGFKLEYLNPTGSFKDRSTAALVSFLLSRGVTQAVEDSSGNAGASFAAYAARAGISARIFMPDSASGPKRAQIEAYGARLTRVTGPRSNASLAVRRAAEGGAVYASHAYQPFGLTGLATLAYEISAQLGGPPGTLIAPAGQGSLLLGAWRGFTALEKAGVIQSMPRLVGVQAAACAPLWSVFNGGAAALAWVTERETLAEGVRIKSPVRGDAVLRAVIASEGLFLAVDEVEILSGKMELAKMGFFVEPTSALIWAGLGQIAETAPEPIVAVLTGSGYKSI